MPQNINDINSIAAKYLKQIYLKIHPDFFSNYPDQKKVNSESFRLLNEVFGWASNRQQNLQRSVNVKFFYWKRRNLSEMGLATFKIDTSMSKENMTRMLFEICDATNVEIDDEHKQLLGNTERVLNENKHESNQSAEDFSAILQSEYELFDNRGGNAAPSMPWCGEIYDKSLTKWQIQTFQKSMQRYYVKLFSNLIPKNVWEHKREFIVYVSKEYDWNLVSLKSDKFLTIPWNFVNPQNIQTSCNLFKQYFSIVSLNLSI